jgi:hypothetical protein
VEGKEAEPFWGLTALGTVENGDSLRLRWRKRKETPCGASELECSYYMARMHMEENGVRTAVNTSERMVMASGVGWMLWLAAALRADRQWDDGGPTSSARGLDDVLEHCERHPTWKKGGVKRPPAVSSPRRQCRSDRLRVAKGHGVQTGAVGTDTGWSAPSWRGRMAVPPQPANSGAARGGLSGDRRAPRISDFPHLNKFQSWFSTQEK